MTVSGFRPYCQMQDLGRYKRDSKKPCGHMFRDLVVIFCIKMSDLCIK